jgi:hypothetical protein
MVALASVKNIIILPFTIKEDYITTQTLAGVAALQRKSGLKNLLQKDGQKL